MEDFTLQRPQGADLSRGIDAPVSQYVPDGTVIEVGCWNSVVGLTIRIRLRIITPQGKSRLIEVEKAPTSDRQFNQFFFQLPECFLQSARVSSNAGAPRRGQLYGTVVLRLDQDPASAAVMHLCRGYITQREGLFWPFDVSEHQLSGKGVILVTNGTDPAAGQECSDTVPDNAHWFLHGWTNSLVTSAVVAARQAYLLIDDGASEVIRFPFVGTQAASLTVNYRGTRVGVAPAGVGTFLFSALGEGIELFAGWRVRTSTGLLDAGDNWAAPRLIYEELIEE